MPLLYRQFEKAFTLFVWEITEPEDFFIEQTLWQKNELKQAQTIRNTKQRLQFLASRFLIKHFISPKAAITKDPCGCPKIDQGYISISHTNTMACLMLSKKYNVGVDLEPIHPKVKRVKSKFLSPQELAFINPNCETEHLICCWSAKETVFKWYAKGNLPFKHHINLQAFNFTSYGNITVDFSINTVNKALNVTYITLKNHILTYLVVK